MTGPDFCGARQVGKTTLVRTTICPKEEAYFNWDDRKVRSAYQRDPDFFVGGDADWICFDEIHKRPKWKDILKGIFDVHKGRFRFVITGSSRLETFKKSGDSLVGRYFHNSICTTQYDYSFWHEAESAFRQYLRIFMASAISSALCFVSAKVISIALQPPFLTGTLAGDLAEKRLNDDQFNRVIAELSAGRLRG